MDLQGAAQFYGRRRRRESGRRAGGGRGRPVVRHAGGAWTETLLYSFKPGTDGAMPVGALLLTKKGMLFGATSAGGTAGFGTVFLLAPPTQPGGSWIERVLHSFQNGADGANPSGRMVFGPNDALYGGTVFGGANHCGTVFQLSPPAQPGGPWTEYILHSFRVSDGKRPRGGVGIGWNGGLYGTTEYGGAADLGTVFQLSF